MPTIRFATMSLQVYFLCCLHGVLQASILGPLLLLTYTNDIHFVLTFIVLYLLFADDRANRITSYHLNKTNNPQTNLINSYCDLYSYLESLQNNS